jgi:hypothetical protein
MRKGLTEKCGRRERFSAKVERFGKKRNYHGFPEDTILLTNIKDAHGTVVADHVWFSVGATFDWLNAGDLIEFDARVTTYMKGYSDNDPDNPRRMDYRLSRPTKLEKTHYWDEESKSYKETAST